MNGSSSTKASSWLRQSVARLEDAGITTARLDCLVLLEDETGKDRAWLLAHPEYYLQGSDLKDLNTKVAQRALHIPLAYIRGKAEFYGREFAVNEHTLVPRPETESMIELLQMISNRESSILSWQDQGRRKSNSTPTARQRQSFIVHTDEGYRVTWKKPHTAKLPQPSASPPYPNRLRDDDKRLRLIDIGTGSGAIAITAKLEHPHAIVTATDIDKNCLDIARNNSTQLGAVIELLHGNLLEPVPEATTDQILVLLCNLPYVPDNFQINTAATHEPRQALFGGTDGLDLYQELFTQAAARNHKPDYILAESLPPQHSELSGIAQAAGYRLEKTSDFVQLFVPAL